MRPSDEIERITYVFTAWLARPCDCAAGGPTHAEHCRIGGMVMGACLDVLRWVAGEDVSDTPFGKMLARAGIFPGKA